MVVTRSRWLSWALPSLGGLAVVAGLTAWALNAASQDRGCSEWPLETVSCELFQSTDSQLLPTAPDAVGAVQVDEVAVRSKAAELNGPGAKVLEAKLVLGGADEKLLWAVSSELPEGVAGPSGAALYASQETKLLAGEKRPLTPEEHATAEENVRLIVAAWYESLDSSYHIDYFDPETGEWKGASEAAKPDLKKFESLLPAGVSP